MTLDQPNHGLVPLQLPSQVRLTPEQFELVCQANPDAVLELAADGQLITTTLTGGDTGQRNLTLAALLWQAARQSDCAVKLFDSSTGFRLPDGSVFSPDVSLIRTERWEALPPPQRRTFPPLCPDWVLELASASDAGPRGVAALRHKMDLYRSNGAPLGWLLLPEARAVEIWRPGDQPPERIEAAALLSAAPLFPDLAIDLTEVWQG